MTSTSGTSSDAAAADDGLADSRVGDTPVSCCAARTPSSIARRSGLVPAMASTRSSGVCFATSATQLYTSEAGQTIRFGRCSARDSLCRASSSDSSCTLLPKPISSARIPPNPLSHTALSQRNPST